MEGSLECKVIEIERRDTNSNTGVIEKNVIKSTISISPLRDSRQDTLAEEICQKSNVRFSFKGHDLFGYVKFLRANNSLDTTPLKKKWWWGTIEDL